MNRQRRLETSTTAKPSGRLSCQEAPPTPPHDAIDIDDGQPSIWEVGIYIVFFMTTFGYAAVDFYSVYGTPSPENLNPAHLAKGWIGKYKDAPEPLEYLFIDNGAQLIWQYAGHLAVSLATYRWTSKTTHHLAVAFFTLSITALSLNWRIAAYLLFVHVASVCMGYFSLAGVWLIVLGAMTMHNNLEGSRLMHNWLEMTSERASLYFPISGYLFCRSISAGHSLNRMLRSRDDVPSFSEFLCNNFPKSLAYGFYLPGFHCGPTLTFKEFCAEVDRDDRLHWDVRSAAVLAWRVSRMIVWLLLLQVFRHFLPVGAYLRALTSTSDIYYKRVMFSTYLYGQNFMLVYLQLYGWPGVVARIDGVRLPHWPDCISRVYSYKKMWRVFDRGLAGFMHNHIYLPLGGSRHGAVRQVAAVVASFGFITIYHGNTSPIRIWCFLNAAQLLNENLIIAVYRFYLRSWMNANLKPWFHQRLVATFAGFNLFFSSCSIFVFFNESNFVIIANSMIMPLYGDRPLWNFLVVQLQAFSIVQISLFYEKRFKQKMRVD